MVGDFEADFYAINGLILDSRKRLDTITNFNANTNHKLKIMSIHKRKVWILKMVNVHFSISTLVSYAIIWSHKVLYQHNKYILQTRAPVTWGCPEKQGDHGKLDQGGLG